MISIGEYTYGNPKIIGEGNCTIGKFCSIAGEVTIFVGHNHNTKFVSTYPFNVPHKCYSGINIEFSHGKNLTGHPCSKGDVIIGNDVWIAQGVTILSGVKIGDGAVLAAKSVVVKDVPPYSICAGNPGKIKKMRFSDSQITDLIELKWWDLPISTIDDLCPLLMSQNVDRLIEELKKIRKNGFK